MIADYNQNMGGVDLCDQLVSYYNISKTSCKWTQRLIFGLIDMCIECSCFIHSQQSPSSKTVDRKHKVFRETLAHQLVRKLLDRRADTDIASPPGPGRPIISTHRTWLGKRFMTKRPSPRLCICCVYKRTRHGNLVDKKTNDYCEKCQKHICQCFKKYHTMSDIK